MMLHKFRVWLDHKLKVDVYSLQDDEIVSGRGRRIRDRIKPREIRAWRIHPEIGFDIVEIELQDGRVLNWFDKYNDLIDILRNVAADRERC